jgi:hypothetical protein
VTEKEILSIPNVKPGKILPRATIQTTKQFYVFDDISNHATVYVSVNSKGKKVYLQPQNGVMAGASRTIHHTIERTVKT